MSSYGETICALRKKAGLTQEELGKRLNVSNQAVSKWEKNLSQPDFETVSRFCNICGVTMDEFRAMTQSEEGAPPVREKPKEPAVPLGVCTVCGRTVTEENVGDREGKLVCADCKKKREENARAREKYIAIRTRKLRDEAHGKIKKSFIVATICAVLFSVIGIVSMAMNGQAATGVEVGLVGALVVFTFVAQLFWEGFVPDVVMGSFKVFGGPGVIFELDLDGIIFLIVAKIAIKLITTLLTIVIFLLGCAFAAFVSVFTFFPAFFRYKGEADALTYQAVKYEGRTAVPLTVDNTDFVALLKSEGRTGK